jgi:hypothetical protein
MVDLALRDFVFKLLGEKIPSHYYFHDQHHTAYVLEKVLEIGFHENCSQQDLRLLQAAALLHDTGYTRNYEQHEIISCTIAREILPGFSYSSEETDQICSMIMATKIPQTPVDKRGEILADADLEYLGTGQAAVEAGKLMKEIMAINPSVTPSAWDERQVEFIRNHHYFTHFCQVHREPVKQAYLAEIQTRLSANS